MSVAQRAASRRGAAAAACLALVAGLVGGLASPAGATDGEAVFKGVHHPVTVSGHFGGGGSKHYQAGMLNMKVDGTAELGYCIDFTDGTSTTTPLPEEEWNQVEVANRETVGRILGSYHPIGDGPEGYKIEGDDDQKAAATQAAIWHFTNGLVLDEPGDAALGSGYEVIHASYLKILAAVEAGVLPQIGGPVTLTIEGDTDVDAAPGDLVGPFTVKTSVASIELVPGTGTTLHNEDGSAFEGPASDGDQFWLTSSEGGTASVSAVAAGVQSGIRAFTHPYKQDMAFVVATPVEVPASIEVTFTTPPPTTVPPTTAPETTTTTVPTTPSTSVEVTTTTAAPPQETGGGLPVTGAQTALLVAVALVLLAAGIVFGVVSRRAKGQA
jgi:hypothetical protein